MSVEIPEIPYVKVEANTKLNHSHDAICTHLYWLREKTGPQKIVQGLRGRFVTLSTAALFYYEKQVFNNEPEIVLAVGRIWGKKYPSVAEVAMDELVNKFKIPRNKIHCLPLEGKLNPKETSRENTAFEHAIIDNGWTHVVKVVEPSHRYRAESSFVAPAGVSVDTLVPDEILRGKVREFIMKFRHSKYEFIHKIYEELINEGLEAGWIDNKFLQITAWKRKMKTPHTNWLLRKLDLKIEPNPNI